MNIAGQILTFISYLIFWVTRYLKTKKSMLLGDNISRFFAIAAFICLGTYDGIKNTLFVIVRNIVGDKIAEKSKKTRLIAFMIMLFTLALLYTPNIFGVSTMCVFICGLFNLYGVIMCEEQGIRLFGLLGGGFYAMFLLFTGNYIGFICELICIIVLITSYCKYRKKKYNE